MIEPRFQQFSIHRNTRKYRFRYVYRCDISTAKRFEREMNVRCEIATWVYQRVWRGCRVNVWMADEDVLLPWFCFHLYLMCSHASFKRIERHCIFFLLPLWKQKDGYIKSEPHIFPQKSCRICHFQMTFLLDANKTWWLNGARSHQCSDLSTEMRHQAEENISMLPINPLFPKTWAILLLSQQTAASWDPNR